MAMAGGEFLQSLSGAEEVQVAYVRGKDGREMTIPVWFAVEGRTLHLLPMYGLKTMWFQEIDKSRSMELRVKRESVKVTPKVVKDAARVESVKAKFGEKYGLEDVKKYYPTSEVALEIQL
jgi:hypothetical protein